MFWHYLRVTGRGGKTLFGALMNWTREEIKKVVCLQFVSGDTTHRRHHLLFSHRDMFVDAQRECLVINKSNLWNFSCEQNFWWSRSEMKFKIDHQTFQEIKKLFRIRRLSEKVSSEPQTLKNSQHSRGISFADLDNMLRFTKKIFSPWWCKLLQFKVFMANSE